MDADAGSRTQRNCVCSSYNFGQPHIVSYATWYRHLQEARSDEERRTMQDAKFHGLNSSTRRARGTASRRRNNLLPPRNGVREAAEAQVAQVPRQDEQVFFLRRLS